MMKLCCTEIIELSSRLWTRLIELSRSYLRDWWKSSLSTNSWNINFAFYTAGTFHRDSHRYLYRPHPMQRLNARCSGSPTFSFVRLLIRCSQRGYFYTYTKSYNVHGRHAIIVIRHSCAHKIYKFPLKLLNVGSLSNSKYRSAYTSVNYTCSRNIKFSDTFKEVKKLWCSRNSFLK